MALFASTAQRCEGAEAELNMSIRCIPAGRRKRRAHVSTVHHIAHERLNASSSSWAIFFEAVELTRASSVNPARCEWWWAQGSEHFGHSQAVSGRRLDGCILVYASGHKQLHNSLSLSLSLAR